MSRSAYGPGYPERPRRYQLLAARAAIRALADRDSTTIAMPWGAGKTWAGILAAERLCPADAPLVHFVPNARHVAMARREWRWRTHRTVIAACAPPAGDDADGEQHQGYDQVVSYAVASPAELAQALGSAPDPVVVCPYDSLGLVQEAQRSHQVPRFAVALLDEVHRTASRAVVRGEEHRLDRRARPRPSRRDEADRPLGAPRRVSAHRARRVPSRLQGGGPGRGPRRRTRWSLPSRGARAGPTRSSTPLQATSSCSTRPRGISNVLELIGHLRRRAGGQTRHVLAALASPRPPREALADALRTELWLRSPLEALANVDERFARALSRAREARPTRTGLLTVLGTCSSS